MILDPNLSNVFLSVNSDKKIFNGLDDNTIVKDSNGENNDDEKGNYSANLYANASAKQLF